MLRWLIAPAFPCRVLPNLRQLGGWYRSGHHGIAERLQLLQMALDRATC